MIVEDHELLSQVLVNAFSEEGIPAVVSAATSAVQLEIEMQRDRINVVLLDLDLGPRGDGVQFVQPATATGAAVIIVTSCTDRLRLAAAVAAGAWGLIGKDQPFDQLLAAVRSAANREPLLDPQERAALLGALRSALRLRATRLRPFERLTPREREVLRALDRGLTAARIARAHFVSVATARSQIHSVLTKLGATSQVEALAMARRAGFLD